MLSQESREKLLQIIKEEWSKYREIHSFNPITNSGFRGGSVEFIIGATAHFKKDGTISAWDILPVEIKDHFKYDV